MNDIPIYINGLGIVSPQKTADDNRFLEEPLSCLTNHLRCIEPVYKDFIPSDMIRRMGRIIKMSIAASKFCLSDAAKNSRESITTGIVPEAIITGTGLGCIEDTEKFLTSMIRDNEEFLTPTSFIQSTHNTVAGQIALLLKCHGYNFTFVHRGISFESAMIDALTQIQAGELSNALVGGSDELTANSFAITTRLGFWKQKPVQSLDILDDKQRGTIAGEGASFLFLTNEKHEHTYARLTGVTAFLRPLSHSELRDKLHKFLATFGLIPNDISLVILGLNGDQRNDQVYKNLLETDFQNTLPACFKHLCGEYHTASSFATWLAARVIREQSVPAVVRFGLRQPPAKLDHVLIYNHFRDNNHAFILLNRP